MLRNKIELRPGREVKKDVWYKFVMAVKVSQNPAGRSQAVGGVQPLTLTLILRGEDCPRAVTAPS